jgi:hypothetical protein
MTPSEKRKGRSPCPNDTAHQTVHLMRYDAFMCPECDAWVEPVCNCEPAECTFKAAGRPERPSQAQP